MLFARAMRPACLKCLENGESGKDFLLHGKYYRRSDSREIQRYRCRRCNSCFSAALFQDCYRQKKRHKNLLLKRLLCSGISQRRSAIILCLNRKTVVKKFLLLAMEAEFILRKSNFDQKPCAVVEFDDLETIEHSKCKPLSVSIAVEFKTRRILGLEVSRMPAKGPLVDKARKLYGRRIDERKAGRERLFKRIRPHLSDVVEIKSDANPHYPDDIKRHFPAAKHSVFGGKRGSLGGQGELKRVRFDPLFSLNHTCAMFRANVNRLFRKTWCTTKRADRLYAHLILYASYHHTQLI